MDSETAALDEGQTVQDDAAKVDGPEHLVDTTMEPASEITQAPPTDIPHDIVNVECRSNDLEVRSAHCIQLGFWMRVYPRRNMQKLGRVIGVVACNFCSSSTLGRF